MTISQIIKLAKATWKAIPEARRREVKAQIREQVEEVAIDFTCGIVENRFGLPSEVCHPVAKQIVKIAKKQL